MTTAVRRALAHPLSAAVTGNSGITRNITRTLTAEAGTSAVAALTKVKMLTLTAAASLSASMIRQSGKMLTAAVNTAAAVAMRSAKILTAITGTTATAGRVIGRLLAAVVPIAGTVATGGGTVFYLTLNAAMNLAGALTAPLPPIARLFGTGKARLRCGRPRGPAPWAAAREGPAPLGRRRGPRRRRMDADNRDNQKGVSG